jgi:KEOPS complex subunit Cgi121
MLTQIEEFHKTLAITGFRGTKICDAKSFLEEVRTELSPEVEVQVFDAALVATWQHLYFAALNALTAFKNGRNLSKSLAVEMVLYVSAQRQIKKAFELVGVKEATANVAMLVVGENADVVAGAVSAVAARLGVAPDESVLELSLSKMVAVRKAFGISDTALGVVSGDQVAAGGDLVVEQLALLATRL